MFNDKNQSKLVSSKLLVIGISLPLFIIMLPSILFLAKVAIRLTMASVGAIAVKIALKIILNVFKGKLAGQELTTQQVIQNKVLNLAIGLVSIIVGGLSLITIGEIGVNLACAAVTVLALYGCFEEIGKSVNDKFNEVANNITDFIISRVLHQETSLCPTL